MGKNPAAKMVDVQIARTHERVAGLPRLVAEDIRIEQPQVGPFAQRPRGRDLAQDLTLEQEAEAAQPFDLHPLAAVLFPKLLRKGIDRAGIDQEVIR
jgi:hypothetical protein